MHIIRLLAIYISAETSMKAKGKLSYDCVLSIDPSINACGWAIHKIKNKKLVDYGLISPKKETTKTEKLSSYLDKARYVMNRIHNLMDDATGEYGIVQLVTEVPAHFGVAGYLARESGSIYKLTFVCGMIAALDDNVICYEPQMWKGQLKKNVCHNRLNKRYESQNIVITDLNHNVADAIGIGYYYLNGRV